MMVRNRKVADKERVIFWFNGGPGCSSFDGAMMEVGPWRWDGQPEGKETFSVKEGGWEEYTTMVFGASGYYPYLTKLHLTSQQSTSLLGRASPTLLRTTMRRP